jgi:hypothetical protein
MQAPRRLAQVSIHWLATWQLPRRPSATAQPAAFCCRIQPALCTRICLNQTGLRPALLTCP